MIKSSYDDRKTENLKYPNMGLISNDLYNTAHLVQCSTLHAVRKVMPFS